VYLEDPSHPEIGDGTFDIITWWKLNGPKYPIISKWPVTFLVFQCQSESAFSTAGLMVDKNRCSLLPTIVEALMCTQDWLRADIPGIYL